MPLVFPTVALESSLGSENGTFFRVEINLLLANNHIYQIKNETRYNFAFCAVRCENAGGAQCNFFILAEEVCYLGNLMARLDTPVVKLKFGYQIAFYRRGEFN